MISLLFRLGPRFLIVTDLYYQEVAAIYLLRHSELIIWHLLPIIRIVIHFSTRR